MLSWLRRENNPTEKDESRVELAAGETTLLENDSATVLGCGGEILADGAGKLSVENAALEMVEDHFSVEEKEECEVITPEEIESVKVR